MHLTELDGRKLCPGTMVPPRLAVVPMGWSWALFLCQSVHESLACKAGLTEDFRLRDRRPVPSTEVLHTQYVDNMIILGTDRVKVEGHFKPATDALRGAGLQVHEGECSTAGTKILGWEFTPEGGFSPGHHRLEAETSHMSFVGSRSKHCTPPRTKNWVIAASWLWVAGKLFQSLGTFTTSSRPTISTTWRSLYPNLFVRC